MSIVIESLSRREEDLEAIAGGHDFGDISIKKATQPRRDRRVSLEVRFNSSLNPLMASITNQSGIQPQDCPPSPCQGLSDGRGGEGLGTLDPGSPRYIHYRLYTKDGPITSNNPVYTNNPFIGRTLPKHITPPRTALSLKKHLCKIEGLPSPTSFELFESLSSHTAVLDSSRLALKEYSGCGFSGDDPIALVVGLEAATKRPASTAQLEGLPKAVPAQPRYVHYRLYDEDGEVASKTSFDSDDSSLGRIDVSSIPPPRMVSLLGSMVMKAEGLFDRKVQLFEDMDGELLMNDDDHISFQTEAYPGHVEDEPIAITFGQNTIFTKEIKGMIKWVPHKVVQPDWLPFLKDEIMYTDGVKTHGFIVGSPHLYNGYIAMNSAGEKGFVHDGHTILC